MRGGFVVSTTKMNELFCELDWLKAECLKRFPKIDSLYISTRNTKVLWEFYKKEPVLEHAKGWSYHYPTMPDGFLMFTGDFRGTIVLELHLNSDGKIVCKHCTSLDVYPQKDLIQLLDKYVVTCQSRAKERQLERCAVYKEELMAATWHPDRVMRWMEAGLDVEDM